MKFCTNCGNKFEGEEKFCTECGAPRYADAPQNKISIDETPKSPTTAQIGVQDAAYRAAIMSSFPSRRQTVPYWGFSQIQNTILEIRQEFSTSLFIN